MRRNSGFTLIELMVAVAVLAILASVGVPSMLDFIRNNRRAAAVNTLVADIQLARSTAASAGTNTVLCHSTSGTACSGSGAPDWSQGWIAFIDDDQDGVAEATDNNGAWNTGEEILSRVDGRPGVTMTSNTGAMGFKSGFQSMSGNGSIEVCIEGADNDRKITLSQTGRPRLTPHDCP